MDDASFYRYEHITMTIDTMCIILFTNIHNVEKHINIIIIISKDYRRFLVSMSLTDMTLAKSILQGSMERLRKRGIRMPQNNNVIGMSTSHRDEHAGKATVDKLWKSLAEPSNLPSRPT